jgi:hypothetical protein
MNPYMLDPELLALLLREAEAAHADYAKSLGHADPDRHAWYARYILDVLDRREHTPVDTG